MTDTAVAKEATEFTTLALTQIKRNPDALRQVTKDEERFLNLCSSIEEHGVLQPVIVRPDPAGGDMFMLVDGDHRFTACQEVGIDEIPVRIMRYANDVDSYKTQIVANLHQIQTKPVEFAKGIRRILGNEPLLTVKDIAKSFGKSTTWVNNRLKLVDMHEAVQKLIDEGKITATNAIYLAQIDKADQINWIDKAMTMPQGEFKDEVDAVVKAARKAAREGRDPNAKKEFVPQARLRKTAELREAMADEALLSTITGNAKRPVDAALNALKWALKLDDASVNAAKAEAEERAKRISDNKEKGRIERLKKARDKANEELAKAVKEEAAKAPEA